MKINNILKIVVLAFALFATAGTAYADNKPHLDLSGGYTFDSGNLQNSQAVYNVTGTLSKQVSKKLNLAGSVGEAWVNTQSGFLPINHGHYVVPNTRYSMVTFKAAASYNLAPNLTLNASYGQVPTNFYLNTANQRGVRETSVSLATRIF